VRILGLDPGSRHTGYGLICRRQDRIELLAQGRLSPPKGLDLPARLGWLSLRLAESLAEWRPEVAVLETPYLGLNPRSLVVLAQARGALLGALAAGRVAVREYSPAEIKSAVTGSGRADKGQVARMVALELPGVPAGTSADATDALAVALCYTHRSRLDRLTTRGV
jgi:crossover junction endodeoxyribonuclease RuvC